MQRHKALGFKAFLPLLALLLTACSQLNNPPGNGNNTPGNGNNQAITFTVNTTADTIDANPGNRTCADSNGNCSLRAAVMEANALTTPVVINIPAGTYKLTRTGSDEQGGDLDIMSDVTLKGAGAGETILDGRGADRVLQIYKGTTVRVEGVKIQNGKADDGGGGIYNSGTLTLTNSTLSGNTADRGGGGIYNDYGATLTLTNSTVSGNAASDGSGGGIYNYRGTLTLTNSTVGENTANYSGGIYNYRGTLTLTNSTLSGNIADEVGGGIDNIKGTLIITNSTISGNTASYGGGIYNDSGTLTLTNSTVSGNKAKYFGGGIDNRSGTLIITNSTISGNTASDGSGGGILNDGDLHLFFSTLTLNQATGTYSEGGGIFIGSGAVRLKGVILAGNTSESGSGPECSGSLTSLGYNLIGSNADCDFTEQDTDITGEDPLLGELTENDGPTKTHLPAANSPVLDKVPIGDCTDLEGNSLATDQRGVSRPQGDKCDIGAVERRPSE